MNKGMFSSNTDQWGTPKALFDVYDSEFHFTVDVCAQSHNAKCDKYFTPEQDGLAQEWIGACWMNPPYGNPESPCKGKCQKKKCIKRGYHIKHYIPGIIDWCRKAYESAQQGATVVCLVPARTDTAWWHDYCMKGEVRFLQGRVRFEKPNGGKNSAPFPSAIVVFRPKESD